MSTAAADLVQYLKDQYTQNPVRLLSLDQLEEPILWAINAKDAVDLVARLKQDATTQMDFLSDVTAYDNKDEEDGPKRFILVYQLYSTTKFYRIRIKCALNDGENAQTLTSVFLGANWPEREVFDMFGIRFDGHPNMRRLLMDERFTGYPLRKEYPIKQREPFADNIRLHLGAESLPPQSTPEQIKSKLTGSVNLKDFYNPNVLINLGPSHPAMHGTLRVMCRINGETIEDAACEIGYLHRAIEKLGEEKTYHQWIVYTDRLNYCSALNNNIAYCMAVENLMKLTVTERCMWVRVVCMELARIIDHIICVAINALDLGAMTVFWLMYHWREEAYTMIESMCGMRLTTSYSRVGGMSYDLPPDFNQRMKKFIEEFPKALDEVEGLLTSNRIWIDRTKDVGILTKEQALSFSVTGPVLRASGVNVDLRRDRPYYVYPELDFDVVVGSRGDVYERYLIRLEEMRQSTRILKQCLAKMPQTGSLWVEDRRVRIPEKHDVYTQMEVLIHHFKIFMEGIDVPPGEGFSCVEGPNGELGFYIVSRGGPKAWRLRVKPPSLMLFQSFEHTVKGGKIPDAVASLGSVNIIAGELDR